MPVVDTVNPTIPSSVWLSRIKKSPEIQIIELANLWEQAYQKATKSSKPLRRFYSNTPSRSKFKVDQVRWKAFLKLHGFLTTENIPQAEFCCAVADYHALVLKRRPNPYQVAGPWGIELWKSWRGRRMAQGNKDQAGLARVHAAAYLESLTPKNELIETIKQAYYDCTQFGINDAPTIMWGADVLWLFLMTEPAIRFAIQRMLAEQSDKERWYQAIKAIQYNPNKRHQLIQLRQFITKTPDPVLKAEPE